MRQALQKTMMLLLCYGLIACSSVVPSEPPKVNLISVVPNSNSGLAPSFDINLRVVNPNKQALNLAGAVYSLSLNGHEVVNGATSELPSVPAYGEATFSLPAQANLMASMQLLGSLLQLKKPELDYQVDVKLDVGSFWPAIRLSEKGQLKLDNVKD
jgi:LEA14-like dessication related protein